MKKLILSAALAAMLATPALAQSYDPEYGTGNSINLQAREWSGDLSAGATGTRAFAQAPIDREQTFGSGYTVPFEYGQYVGTDPDPNIRLQLHRDPPGLD